MPNKGLGRCFSLIGARKSNNASLALAGCETAETRLITRYICNRRLIEHKQARAAKVNGVKAAEMPGHLFCGSRIYSSLTHQDFINKINGTHVQPDFSPSPVFPFTMKDRQHDLTGAAVV